MSDREKDRVDDHERRIERLEELVGEPVEVDDAGAPLRRRPTLQEQFESFRGRLDRQGLTRRRVP